ncbi:MULTISPECIES: GntR family transcriptional regulator [Streptomyces]|uniref:GntR family transcriptional regulator n=1 Tax=Streptomyces TaxID=1883 RepID=UPI000AEDCC55|nr:MULTISPECIES: GntR family transcriptional regulator [Streptomyces]MBP5872743.1 GntR family transcriptional regulator [Streptomyces sp. LBUM 1485]MBP5873255.1 GntR family transcriptional regulator [Streptomyces sp. LBUM 1477]MBP5880937.1 GntR family transcriptional regulator [Streptomyces sp. LBUM 1487]MBP5896691.1 GntR family transcriptional regulator [Streptomyces sp. LBUM 1488]MBP5911032.1 GntR family transcriptional regulator [Streptomyces sp. LBUM 1486]
MAVTRIASNTRSESVVTMLRNAILDGTFPAGSQLRETHLAEEMGVSRTTLREGLQRLDEEGLVTRVPFRGSFVAEVSREVIAEIESLRSVLEPFAIERALPSLMTPEGSAELVEAVEALTEKAEAGDVAGCIDTHLAVHRALYRAADHRMLFDMWLSWESQLRLFLAVDHQSFAHLSDLAANHQRLLACIRSGDLDRVREELTTHIRPGLPAPDSPEEKAPAPRAGKPSRARKKA